MIPAFIVLLVIALALGAYIAFDAATKNRKPAAVDTAEASETAPTPAPVPDEHVETTASEAEIAKTHDERKLIKKLTDRQAQSGTAFEPREIRQSVTAREVDGLMRDEVAAHLLKIEGGVSNRTKQSIINIDTISEHFESGEVVTLDEIKKRVKGFNKQTTYLKVLARGTLDKALTVEADGFSLQAVKMIVLTGGTAIKKR